MPKASTIIAAYSDRPHLHLDGTNEIEQPDLSNMSLHRSNSIEVSKVPENHSSKVHFADLNAQETSIKSETLTCQPTFQDPFLGTHIHDRRASDASSSSGTVRPGAFAHHRDTFWRLFDANNADADQDDNIFLPAQAIKSNFRKPGWFGHRDTLARLHFKQNCTISVPDSVLENIAAYLDGTDYQNMRLTCQRWAEHLPHRRYSLAQTLPTEVTLKILSLLQLPEYDAAKHTCKSWFTAGLDHKLAVTILRRSGIHSAYLQDVEHQRLKFAQHQIESNSNFSDVYDSDLSKIDHEWLASKRLATECMLSGH